MEHSLHGVAASSPQDLERAESRGTVRPSSRPRMCHHAPARTRSDAQEISIPGWALRLHVSLRIVYSRDGPREPDTTGRDPVGGRRAGVTGHSVRLLRAGGGYGSQRRRSDGRSRDRPAPTQEGRPLVQAPQFRPYPFGMDIVVYTPQEIEEGKKSDLTFISAVLREGKTLYEPQNGSGQARR